METSEQTLAEPSRYLWEGEGEHSKWKEQKIQDSRGKKWLHSLRCTPEINIKLQLDYTSIKRKEMVTQVKEELRSQRGISETNGWMPLVNRDKRKKWCF